MDSDVIEATDADTAGTLRNALVDDLRENGAVHSDRVEAALRAVPRHLFVPGVPLPRAYANDVVSTKQNASGASISAASQPSIVALMLEQADIEPGHRVLEIGAGTGYNAALLAHLAGTTGRVSTIDIDEDIIAAARANLAAAGFNEVRALCGDGALGDPTGAPYDRVIATVGAWDPPPAWLDQVADGGRLIVPMRIRGSQSRSIVFERNGRQWISRDSQMCGFMPLRGLADDAPRTLPLSADRSVTLPLYQDQAADADTLRDVLGQPRHEAWTGVRFGPHQSLEYLWLWLSCALDNALSRMQVSQQAMECGQITTRSGVWIMATLDGNALAYLPLRPIESDDSANRQHEIGVIGHGPNADDLVARVVKQILRWGSDYRSRQVRFTLQAAGTAPPLDGQFIFAMSHHLLSVTWD